MKRGGTAGRLGRDRFRVADFIVDPDCNLISSDAGDIRAEPRIMALLVVLADRAGRVVDRDVLIDEVWNGACGADQSLTNAIASLRRLLGENRASARLIETIPKRGYRLTAPVRPAMALREAEMPPSDEASVAVLPFANLSADPVNAYLADGISEELLNALAAVERLDVVARSSSFALRAAELSLPEIGRRLKARFVLSGSLQKCGERVRVLVELSETTQGRSRWTKAFAFEADDPFRIQEEVASEIIAVLPKIVGLAPEETPRSQSGPTFLTRDAEAYRLFVHGRALSAQRTQKGMRLAVRDLLQALERDPEFAGAWGELAVTLSLHAAYGYGLVGDAPNPRRAARLALELDPGQADSHAALGLLAIYEGDAPQSIRHLEKAVALRPSYAKAFSWLAWSNNIAGRCGDALAAAERAVQLDPLSIDVLANYSLSCTAAGRPKAGADEARRVAEIQPDYATAAFYEALALYGLGELKRAEILLAGLALSWADEGPRATRAVVQTAQGKSYMARQTLAAMERDGRDPFSVGLVRLALGDRQAAFEAFGKVRAPLPGRGYWPSLALNYFFSSIFAEVRSTPDYARLVQRVAFAWGCTPEETAAGAHATERTASGS